MYDFHRQLFKNIQQATMACINIKIKYGSSFFTGIAISAQATCITWVILLNVLLTGSIVVFD